HGRPDSTRHVSRAICAVRQWSSIWVYSGNRCQARRDGQRAVGATNRQASGRVEQ
ncbi:hypothetical protein LPJ71_011366, partial [Coemansia sp. S17]